MTAGLTLPRLPSTVNLVDAVPTPPTVFVKRKLDFHHTEEGHAVRRSTCSILFTELPLLERPAAAKAGRASTRSSSGGRWPVAVPARRRGRRVRRAPSRDAGVQLVGLNFFAGDMPGGDRGLVSWPARSARVPRQHRRHRRHRRAARLPGVQRALRQPRRRRRRRRSRTSWPPRTSRSRPAAAQRIGGTVLVEPVSGAPRYPLLTAADALAVDRPGGHGGRQRRGCCSTSTTWPSTATTSTPRSTRTPAGSATSRSPTPPAAASPAPASSTSTRYLRPHRGHRLRRLGRPGVQAHRRPAPSLRLAAARAPRRPR